MDAKSACDLINDLTCMPGWTIEATEYTERHEDAIRVEVYWEGPDYSSDPSTWHDQSKWMSMSNEAVIMAGFHDTDGELLRALVTEAIVPCFVHECRESLRILSDGLRAPLHPHRSAGMRAWGDIEGDKYFGASLP